jgi:hypothetical protein
MPITTSSRFDPAWVTAFPDVLAALSSPMAQANGMLDRYQRVLDYAYHLTVPQTADAQRIITEIQVRPANDVAQEYDAWNVPNGVYEVSCVSETFRYNIHLVTSGDLAGQRVLKRYVDGRYKAFAYITRIGTMKLWRRFAADDEATYVVMAEEFLQAVREIGRDRLFSERSFRIPSRALSIEFTPRCFHCNTQYAHSGIFNDCCSEAECNGAHPASLIDMPDRWVDVEAQRREAEARREQLEQQRRELAAAEQQRTAERIAAARQRLLRSEVTPAEIR